MKRRTLLLGLVVAAAGCSGDSDPAPGDGGPLSDTHQVDRSTADIPTGPTSCGNEVCEPTEICVQCNCGGPTSFACTAVPTGCESDRSCACLGDKLCPEGAGCGDQGDNTILCETGMD